MICGDCGTRLPVDRTSGEAITIRVHTCACGSRWESTQKVTSRLPSIVVRHATGSLRVRANSPPVAAANLPVRISGAGGVGGGLPSGQGSGSDPDPLSVDPPNRARGRRRSNSAPADYTAAFEQLWRATAMTGGKRKAFEAWWRLDRPDPIVVADAWARWMRLEQWQRGVGVMHVSSWLNGRCHEQEPREVTRRTAEADARERARERTRRDSAAAVAATDLRIIELRRAARRVAAEQEASQGVSDVVRELAEAKAVR